MISAMHLNRIPNTGGCVLYPASTERGKDYPASLVIVARIPLPTDPIGTTTATFSGVPASSEIRVYRADGVELAGVESSAANPSLTWSVYAPGANSVNRIVIINLGYRIKEFSYTPAVGNVTIPVQMDADGWYSNPA